MRPGYGAIAAGDGLEALELIHDEVALVVLDLQMPRMDGVAFHGELRARGFETPVVLLSGSSKAEATARDLRAACCIRKPFDIDDLVHRVQRLLPLPNEEAPAARRGERPVNLP